MIPETIKAIPCELTRNYNQRLSITDAKKFLQVLVWPPFDSSLGVDTASGDSGGPTKSDFAYPY